MLRSYTIAGTFLLLFLSSSCKKDKEIPPDGMQIPDSLAENTLEDEIPSNAPTWYVTEYNETNFCYAKGTARSRKVTIARDKAIMKAQVELARKFELNSTDELKGSLVKQQKQIREGNLWRIFVLLEAPVDSNQTVGKINY